MSLGLCMSPSLSLSNNPSLSLSPSLSPRLIESKPEPGSDPESRYEFKCEF